VILDYRKSELNIETPQLFSEFYMISVKKRISVMMQHYKRCKINSWAWISPVFIALIFYYTCMRGFNELDMLCVPQRAAIPQTGSGINDLL
jgi:hypothetical protein